MYWKSDDFASAEEASQMAAMRTELREIARQLRALSGTAPRTPDLLADRVRAQIERIQLPRAA